MFIGVKHSSTSAVTIDHAETFDTVHEANGVKVLLNVATVIAADAILSLDAKNYTHTRLTVLSPVALTGVVFSIWARASATDAWTEVKSVDSASQAFDNSAHLGVVIQVSNSDIVQALLGAYNDAQYAIIVTLTDAQQLVFATGTAAQKKAIINTLTIEQQAAFTSTPVQFIQTTEQIAADKLRLDQIIFKLKSGQFVNDDDSVFYSLGNSLMATAAMGIIDIGGGFDELRTAGLTQAQALSVLSIYNVNLDTNKYESEVALKIINDDPAKLAELKIFLSNLTPPLTLPPLTPYLAQLRADHAVYENIRFWNGL